MSTLKGAKRVIQDLKRQGYEAYIVGGAVRDYILRQPLTDVDITTNAKPFQVAKLFKTKPTGLKYGTVTVFMGTETYEVTTYRIDGEYVDGRHPEEVTYSESVVMDVARRDFTINGLLMTESDEIIDYVDGRKDIESKLIKTIGNPNDRFDEDALRMMRAFYFQSKLGFQIDRETREAISNLKDRLKDVSMERILAEMIKILQGKYLKMAFQSMITTGVSKVLPGLHQGIEYTLTLDELPFVDVFFTLAFTLNGHVPSEWTFSNKHRHRYEIASKLAIENKEIDAMMLYTYGIDLCLLANRVTYMLKRSKNKKVEIETLYQNLPIQSDLDLKLRATEIIKIANRKAGAWVKEIQTKMVVEVINRRLENNREALIEFVKAHLE
ncbi:MAG: CCA tRNA nucleotidyltransferase [Acholeplasmataceae bacterium]|jgi:tRNA nucleotidyltransferase (CCA-adding enzyme)|nr:CCA tRNA nucleotidyltransferase [Acholeplasmataceae bacterium]